MHVPTTRVAGALQVPELLKLDYAGRRSEPMPAAMMVLVKDLLNTDAEDVAEEQGSVSYWAARASNAMLHGMSGPYLKAIETVFPSRKAQGRLYLLGSMILAKYVDDLDEDDVETIVELWNEAPTVQLAFAAELGMRRELSEATSTTLPGVESCRERACTYWN